ncbi:ComEC/Rec2 family competence protein [Nocardioides sp. Bht2]|uniref:ComEC/Rec2 family competence protein n=1 Tax=Nocardioides sp. Bht2 TaxID=3392297 RepID=UPI0039B66D36
MLVAVAVLLPFAIRRFGWRAVVAWVVLATAVGVSASWRDATVADSSVAQLAATRQAATVELLVTSDPRRLPGGFTDQVTFRATLRAIHTETGRVALRAPVVVVATPRQADHPLGSRLRVLVRSAPSEDHDVAARLRPLRDPERVEAPSRIWRAAGAVRDSVRTHAGGPDDGAALVPALVVGDDAGLSETTRTDFRRSGLTHLLAVSGTNLTLVVGFLVLLGRWLGVRGRWHYLVAVLGIVGFVLVARTEPSVVRAAAMGAAALVGMAHNGTRRGVRALGLAVLVLLVWQPWLATTVGFALSALATGGILLLAPPWTRVLSRWLPAPLAAAVTVPLAAQIACTPIVAAISGEVSLVAVLANLLAAPLVAPATICGLFGGLLGLIADPLGNAVATPGGWCAALIVKIAEGCAGIALPAVSWGSGGWSVALLTALCAGLVVTLPWLFARPRLTLLVVIGLILVMLTPIPRWGWPPQGWAAVLCDVGQGDAVVLNAGSGAAVVVDAGPEPAAVDRCLDELGVREIPLLVLTHFHADHTDGLAGVGRGRRIGALWISPVVPPAAAALAARGRVPTVGETRQVGAATLQVLGPATSAGLVAAEPNDASLVLLAEVAGVSLLLTGDIEPPAQQALARVVGDLRVDVLKVPHHGSRAQELDFLLGLRPSIAAISVGADNDYGHPAPELVTAFERAGVQVVRTDRGGDIALRRRSEVTEVVR